MSRSPFSIFAQQYFAALLSDFGTVYLDEPVPRNPRLRVYKHPSRTNFGTEILGALTEGNPQVRISPEIIGEAALVDVLFEPDPHTSRAALGVLGNLLGTPCIIASLSSRPTPHEFRTCLGHWLRWQVESEGGIIPVDETRVDDPDDDDDCNEEDVEDEAESIDKRLLVIVPEMTVEQLESWGAKPSHPPLPGLYELPPIYGTMIVFTRELPQTHETLWLRLLGQDSIQRSAIEELIHLETNHPLRAAVLHPLQAWFHQLSESQGNPESELLMQLLNQIEV
jgi:hypothetical protein